MLCGCLRHSADCADYRLDPDGYFSIYHAVSDERRREYLLEQCLFLRMELDAARRLFHEGMQYDEHDFRHSDSFIDVALAVSF